MKKRAASRPSTDAKKADVASGRRWTFLTKHAAVLLFVAEHPNETMREIASALGITERTTAAVIADLRETGYIEVEQRSRRNYYHVKGDKPLRRTRFQDLSVGQLIRALRSAERAKSA